MHLYGLVGWVGCAKPGWVGCAKPGWVGCAKPGWVGCAKPFYIRERRHRFFHNEYNQKYNAEEEEKIIPYFIHTIL